MENLAEEPKILNGNKYDKSYFMARFWDGLKEYQPNNFSDSKIKAWDDKIKIVQANTTFKC